MQNISLDNYWTPSTSVENWDDVSYTVEIHFEIFFEESWINKVSEKS